MRNTITLSHNERQIVDVVRNAVGIQRSQLHTKVPLTQPSVHRITDNLVEKGLLLLGESKASGPGKPSPEMRINASRYYSVGVVVNTDAISICLANLACEAVANKHVVGHSHDMKQALELVQHVIDEMLQSVPSDTAPEVVGICFSISGFFAGKRMSTPLPLREWADVDLEDALSQVFDMPIYVENNATSSAIGESLIGVGRWAQTFAYLSFNYGFGGGIILDGKPYRGASGNAMEISTIYKTEIMQHRPALASLLQLLQSNDIDVQTIAELRSRFDPAWPGVEDWVVDVLPQLNLAIWAIRATFDPEVIVFGGEIPEALAYTFMDRVSMYSDDNPRYGIYMPAPKIVYTEVPNANTALGAAITPLKAQFFP
ncbi:MAG: ROK family protein [Chloroflexota bacterium]